MLPQLCLEAEDLEDSAKSAEQLDLEAKMQAWMEGQGLPTTDGPVVVKPACASLALGVSVARGKAEAAFAAAALLAQVCAWLC